MAGSAGAAGFVAAASAAVSVAAAAVEVLVAYYPDLSQVAVVAAVVAVADLRHAVPVFVFAGAASCDGHFFQGFSD